MNLNERQWVFAAIICCVVMLVSHSLTFASAIGDWGMGIFMPSAIAAVVSFTWCAFLLLSAFRRGLLPN